MCNLPLPLQTASERGIGTWCPASSPPTHRSARFYGVDPALGAAGAVATEFERRIHPNDLQSFRETIGAGVRTGKAFKGGRISRAATGQFGAVGFGTGPRHGYSRRAARNFIGVAVDITRRKATEAALHESEERFRLVAESAPVMLWMGDHLGKCVYLNRELREFWGIDESNVSTFDWRTTLHPDDRDVLSKPFARGMRPIPDYRRSPLSPRIRWCISLAEHAGATALRRGRTIPRHDRRERRRHRDAQGGCPAWRAARTQRPRARSDQFGRRRICRGGNPGTHAGRQPRWLWHDRSHGRNNLDRARLERTGHQESRWRPPFSRLRELHRRSQTRRNRRFRRRGNRPAHRRKRGCTQGDQRTSRRQHAGDRTRQLRRAPVPQPRHGARMAGR